MTKTGKAKSELSFFSVHRSYAKTWNRFAETHREPRGERDADPTFLSVPYVDVREVPVSSSSPLLLHTGLMVSVSLPEAASDA